MSILKHHQRFLTGIAAGAIAAIASCAIAAATGFITLRPGTVLAAGTSPVAGGLPTLADLIARVGPSVVSVFVQGPASGLGSDAQPATPIAEGTAFFISADGYLVTAEHVVHDAQSVQISTTDGERYSAAIVGSDYWTDIAVLKVASAKPFPFVGFAEQAPRVGDWIVGIGNPFGLSATAAAGIVSAVSRDLGDPYLNYLQVDARTDEGDSGGPIFDLAGDVVGVDDAIVSQAAGGSPGIGFAIPAGTAKMISTALVKSGSIGRVWLGLHVQDGAIANLSGALVSDVDSNGPAAQAGIISGDVITAVNGADITDARDLTQSLIGLDPGTSVKLGLLHGGQMETIAAMLEVMSPPP